MGTKNQTPKNQKGGRKNQNQSHAHNKHQKRHAEWDEDEDDDEDGKPWILNPEPQSRIPGP